MVIRMKKDIKSICYEQLIKEIQLQGEKPFRGKQIYEWIHKKQADCFLEMTNLSKELREKLEADYTLSPLHMVQQVISKDGTTKFLFELSDHKVIESVLMRYKHGNSVCISSQVGCKMGCRFCASTLGGLERNLSAGEMLDQIYQIQKLTKERVSHVVVMGTGEPLDNYENLILFIKMLSDEYGLHISQRNITISTCGIVEKIAQLAQLQLQITVAISLHAPNDEVRRQLMPIANRYNIEEIIEVCKKYYEITGRRITFEYSLVKKINDQEEHAKELASLLKGFPCHVNLIPVNPIKEREYAQSEQLRIQNFKLILEKNRINVTIRREMGADINAACGQLRKSYIEQTKNRGEEER